MRVETSFIYGGNWSDVASMCHYIVIREHYNLAGFTWSDFKNVIIYVDIYLFNYPG